MKVVILAGAAGIFALSTSLGAQQAAPAASKTEPLQQETAPSVSDPAAGASAGSADSASAAGEASSAKSGANDPLAPSSQSDQPTKPKKSAKKKK